MRNAADHYLAERVMTATPAELTAMLYDACSAHIRGGITRLENGAKVEATARLSKAIDIVLELRATLDRGAGPIAEQLDSLYAWCFSRLLEASARGNVGAAHEALEIVEGLRTAWREACLAKAA